MNRWLWAFVSKEMVEGLETEERRSVYAKFVERLEKFVTQEGKWQRKIWGCLRTTE
ncbi:MAG: hypothetical protein ACXQT5_05470 [Candidatus Syntropharchaeia archaeon]